MRANTRHERHENAYSLLSHLSTYFIVNSKRSILKRVRVLGRRLLATTTTVRVDCRKQTQSKRDYFPTVNLPFIYHLSLSLSLSWPRTQATNTLENTHIRIFNTAAIGER